MNFFDAIILGIVEGFTEFLPVSSTGHLILASSLLDLVQTDFLKSFEIAIQLGAILSVVALYYRQFLNLEILKKLVVAFIPTGIIGLLSYKIVKTFLIGNEFVVILALILGGAALIAFEYFYRPAESADALESVTYTQSALIGFFQSIAIIPGVSRAAATIVGGLLLGLGRKTVVEFSFLLAVPTMLGATALDMLGSAADFSTREFGLLAVGFLVAFLVAILAIKFLLAFIERYSFVPFGVYRIVIGVLFLLVLL